jgi:hypothetical protein
MSSNLYEYLCGSCDFGFMFKKESIHKFFDNHEEIIDKLNNFELNDNYKIRRFVEFCDDVSVMLEALCTSDISRHSMISRHVNRLKEEIHEVFDMRFNYLINNI